MSTRRSLLDYCDRLASADLRGAVVQLSEGSVSTIEFVDGCDHIVSDIHFIYPMTSVVDSCDIVLSLTIMNASIEDLDSR